MNFEAIPEDIESYYNNSDKLFHQLLAKVHPVDLQFLLIAYLMNQNIKFFLQRSWLYEKILLNTKK